MSSKIKKEAHLLIDQLPESAGWEELMERIWLRQSVEAGLRESDEGRTTSVGQLREEYGLSPVKVYWTHQAKRQLASIHDHIAEDSPR